MSFKRPFEVSVIEAVSFIPYGKIETYGQIADFISAYGRARQVG